MDCLWVISYSKKALFWKKVRFYFFINLQADSPVGKEHVLVGNALDWQKFNWHKSHRRNGDPQLKHNHLLFSLASFQCSPQNSDFPFGLSPWLQSQLTICFKTSSFKGLNKGSSDSMFVTIYFKNVLQFCWIWKTSFLRIWH